MTRVNTQISFGYAELIKTFCKANELDVSIEERIDQNSVSNYITAVYEDNSDTAFSITFMSVRHLGFENMLCDYLIKCGVHSSRINMGKQAVNRDMEQLDRQWEEHKKHIGLS